MTKFFEGIIYILLGVVAATIIIALFTSLPSNLAEVVEEITEILLFITIILLSVPAILKKHVDKLNSPILIKLVYALKHTHIILGILFVSLRILHVEINLSSESLEWDMEAITSILLSVVLIPTVLYSILRIKNSEKYRKAHRFFLTLTYLTFIIHLFH